MKLINVHNAISKAGDEVYEILISARGAGKTYGEIIHTCNRMNYYFDSKELNPNRHFMNQLLALQTVAEFTLNLEMNKRMFKAKSVSFPNGITETF